MSTLQLLNDAGAPSGEIELSDELLCRGANRRLLHDAVTMHRANQRQGTANSKSKSEIVGSNKKPWRQKGSGRARAGYQSSPVWRGGAVAFGPKPRSYHKRMTRKAARKAFALALTEKIDQGAVRVVEGLSVDQPKTKILAGVLRGLGLDGRALVLVATVDRNLALASRNLPLVEVKPAQDAGAYDILRHPRILITRDGLEILEQRLRKAAGKDEA